MHGQLEEEGIEDAEVHFERSEDGTTLSIEGLERHQDPVRLGAREDLEGLFAASGHGGRQAVVCV